jgi:lipopolysaccharide biosynthesis protein
MRKTIETERHFGDYVLATAVAWARCSGAAWRRESGNRDRRPATIHVDKKALAMYGRIIRMGSFIKCLFLEQCSETAYETVALNSKQRNQFYT